MLILTVRTDNPQAEIGLFQGSKQLAYQTWHAHRELSASIHKTIQELLQKNKLSWQDINGIVFYKGPGSFTGLRIGASVTNALATDKSLPVVSMGKEDWLIEGIRRLQNGQNDKLALPNYGDAVIATQQKK